MPIPKDKELNVLQSDMPQWPIDLCLSEHHFSVSFPVDDVFTWVCIVRYFGKVLFNLFEYKLVFEVKKSQTSISDKISADRQYSIDFKYINCNSSKLPQEKEKKRNKTKTKK